MAFFNVLNGLHTPSSATTVSRAVNTGQGPFVKGQCVKAVNGKYTVADTAATDSLKVEFVHEDLSGNSSGMITGVFGKLEAETDQYDTVTPISDGDYVTCGTGGKLFKTATKADALGFAVGAPANGILRFRTF